MEGPQFSTRAESNLYRVWGADVIGMTNLTEAKLAREAEICYASLALVTDYDCWREATEAVSVETISTVLSENAAAARRKHARRRRPRGSRPGLLRLPPGDAVRDPDRPQGDLRAQARRDAAARPIAADGTCDGRSARAATGRLVVTGSVAFDYLMTFPGTIRRAPDPRPDGASFRLVPRGRNAPRAGRLRARTSPTAWRCWGRRPLLFATAGRDAAAYRERLEREGVDVTGLLLHEMSSPLRSSSRPTRTRTSSPPSTPARWPRARDLRSDRSIPAGIALVVVSPNDPPAMARYAAECRRVRDPVSLRSQPAGGAALRRGARARGSPGAAILIVNDYEIGILDQKTGWRARSSRSGCRSWS